tara:strand:+ start:2184 stop:2726 length:543 start_codon:yes stop_codon:yes gene_type:complete
MLSPIEQAFKAGLKMRTDQTRKCGPMPFSLYKLREYHRDLVDTKEALDEIGKYARTGPTPYALRRCMGYEKSKWAKGMPDAEAYALGKNFIGVIYALTGDDVPRASVRRIECHVQSAIPTLLHDGHFAHHYLNSFWPTAGKRLGTGEGFADRFIQGCLVLIQWVLDEVEKCCSEVKNVTS